MTYFLCALFSVSIIYYLETNQLRNISLNNKIICSKNIYNLFFFILLILWTCVIGLQYEVGTDYNSYKIIFSNAPKMYYYNREYFFYYLLLFIKQNNIHYQFGFIIIAFLQFICFFIFLKILKISNIYLFIFLFFFFCTAFYNQTNGIRQYTAVYIFLPAFYLAYKKKLLYFIALIIIASSFHISALALLPFYFLSQIKTSKLFLSFLLLFSFLISLLNIDFLSFIVTIIFEQYSHYLKSDLVSGVSLINKLTKYIYIPFFLLSLFYSYKNLNKKEKFFYQAGYVSFCIKILSLSSRLLSRFAIYFDVLTIFPLYYYFLYLFLNNKIIKYERIIIIIIFFSIVFSMFFIKTIIFPADEYDYKSILFK